MKLLGSVCQSILPFCKQPLEGGEKKELKLLLLLLVVLMSLLHQEAELLCFFFCFLQTSVQS